MPKTTTPAERQLLARLAAHERWAREPDPTAATRPAREAFAARFEREADPDSKLPLEERARRAHHLRRAYFVRLALASARARRNRRGGA